MKNLSKKLILPILAGIMSITLNCTSAPKIKPWFYNSPLFLSIRDNDILIGADTDGDNKEDTRYFFRILAYNEKEDYFLLKPIKKAIDKDRNGYFEEEKGEIEEIESEQIYKFPLPKDFPETA